jgi:hypothetical protein
MSLKLRLAALLLIAHGVSIITAVTIAKEDNWNITRLVVMSSFAFLLATIGLLTAAFSVRTTYIHGNQILTRMFLSRPQERSRSSPTEVVSADQLLVVANRRFELWLGISFLALFTSPCFLAGVFAQTFQMFLQLN